MGRILLCVLIAVGLAIGVGIYFWPRPPPLSVDYKMPGNPGPKITAAQAAAIERREQVIDQTIWKKEMEAQEHGRVFERFWDALNAATNKWEVVNRLKFAEMVFGDWNAKESLGHAIERWVPTQKSESPRVDSYAGWMEKVRNWKDAGWGIMQCEFRHNAFDPQTNGFTARSKFYFSVHLTNAAPSRAVVEGDLMVDWMLRETNQPPAIRRIDASALQVMFRAGAPAFVPILTETFDVPDLSPAIEPLLVYDLDYDDIPEIALPALNRLYRRRGNGYEAETFCSTPRLQVLNGLFADLDSDGNTDFLYVGYDGVFLLKGAPGGRFDTAPRTFISKMEEFSGPRAITCADIDGDGDLDIFIGQYKAPYTGGSMPTPYYDANDGYAWFLFLNDGAGHFAKSEAGLAAKQFRRVYQASFVDLNGDGALDLVVTSDFAGMDIFRNDGRGKFTDVTAILLDEPHAFGMGHAFGDFNNDGRLDLYVTGMTSPTADRLDHLGLQRPNSKLDPTMRARMAFGSRLYFGRENGGFPGAPLAEQVARTGWSWGVSAADFDNDGWLDLSVVNGMETMRKVRDYEREFWLRDIFVGDSRERAAEELYFTTKNTARRRASESFGGFDKNRLFMNRAGQEFVNVAHLFGVALEDDCRNLVATDLDGDGDVDLILTSQHSIAPVKEKLRVFRNELPNQGNWIAFSFRDEPGHLSPIGAQVILQADSMRKIAVVVNGDSFRSQHPAQAHFGLGKIDKLQEAEIHWPDGVVTRLAGPEINRTHSVRAPKRY